VEDNQFQNYNQVNFDPNDIGNMTSTVILCIAVIDISPSIHDYAKVMNDALRELYIQELKNSHRKNDIMVKAITFNNEVKHVSGFQPILSVSDDYLSVSPSGRATALYTATLEALMSAKQYREDLEIQGIEVRTSVLVITDGEDNHSAVSDLTSLKREIQEIRSNESWANSFTIKIIGVKNEANFENAAIQMGLDPKLVLIKVDATGKELRSAIGVVSQSTTSNTASTITF